MKKAPSPGLWLVLLFAPGLALPARARDPQPSREAVQTIYRNGVPHTEKTGERRMVYSPEKSFFQIAMWGVPLSAEFYGYVYDWQLLKDLGCNTVWPFFNMPPMESLRDGDAKDLQVVVMGATHQPEVLRQIADKPEYREHLLALMWRDEPSTTLKGGDLRKDFADFKAYLPAAHKILSDIPVFINDATAFTLGGEPREYWFKWARAGDIICQDNYPIRPSETTSIGKIDGPPGISESISLAVATADQKKPVWAILGAFGDNAPATHPNAFRFSTSEQFPGQVYAALIHGATGIIYFAWDTYILRYSVDGINANYGISSDPRAEGYVLQGGENAPKQGPATPEDLKKSKALWTAVGKVNTELQALGPAILSPTVKPEDVRYTVKLSNLSARDDEKLYAPNPVRTLLKKDPNGRYILLAVNLDGRTMDAAFGFSKAFSGVEPMFGLDPALSALKDVQNFTAHFGPFERKVFMLKPSR